MLINNKGGCCPPSKKYCFFKDQSDTIFVYFLFTPWCQDCNAGSLKSHLFVLHEIITYESDVTASATFLADVVMQVRMNLRLLNPCPFNCESTKLTDQPFELLNPSAVHNKCHRYVMQIITLDNSWVLQEFLHFKQYFTKDAPELCLLFERFLELSGFQLSFPEIIRLTKVLSSSSIIALNSLFK